MPPSDDEDSDALSDASEVEGLLSGKGKAKATVTDDDRRTIVQSSFDAYFALSAAKVSTSSNIFSALIQPLSAEEYAESITAVDALGSKHLQSSILREPARSALFARLLCELNEGFNVVCYGFGSKRNILNQFATAHCAKAGHVVVVNGFQPELSVKDVLVSIENIRGITGLPLASSMAESQARRIYDFFSQSPKQRHLYLVVHNIDSFLSRTPKAKACFALLALHPHIHLIASVDHINAPLLWSASEVAARKDGVVLPGKTPPRGFAWLWHDLTTLAPYDFELSFADRTSVTGAHARRQRDAAAGAALPSGAAMSQTAAQHILASVTERARKLFALMGQWQLKTIDEGDPTVDGLQQFAIPYDVLFPLARDNFVATNDTALRAVLGEFRDHGLVVTAQGGSGGEVLWIPLRKERLAAIVKSLNVS
ncbi:origin recognition complex, subunit 2 [Mycena rosella]|uniref:Origin recognition complex subunit 2 n=1 Tax=Mycena rosella TaxID=1033263 RepID=A0AAD7DNB4_MYCRO|nr:origin recognition complex, subunit 2 [Mycena rosella]